MKLRRDPKGNLRFYLTRREAQLVSQTLAFYPLLNSDFHRLSKTLRGSKARSAQRLLEQAMAQQRRSHRLEAERFIKSFARSTPARGVGVRAARIDSLLQILNDVRVGSWLKLDQPDFEHGRWPKITEETLPYLMAMECCGLFQSAILHSLEAAESSGPAENK
jgi:hypothetical protein